MEFMRSVGKSLVSGFEQAKTAVTGTPAAPPSVSDGYPPMGARRRGKKTKKAGRRHRKTRRV
jgi:hypothetical protein